MSGDRAPTALTRVELFFVKDRIERTLRFGKPAAVERSDAHGRIVLFAPGAVFAVLRWRSGALSAADNRIAILRAVGPDEAFTTHPDVAPGAEVLLDLTGMAAVQAVLAAIDAVGACGVAPETAAPDYWRHVGARLAGGLPPRAYSRARHRAWRLRKAILR